MPSQDLALQPFVERYAPSDVHQVSDEFAQYAATRFPQALVQLQREVGLGWYGDQELLLVDPGEWMSAIETWFGSGVQTIPFAVTSFGHVYHVGPSGQVQCLDPHFLTNTIVAPDVVTFFNDHLTSTSSHLADLRGPHGGARQKLGPLEDGELYFFTPILPLGGTVSPNSLDKGDGVNHLVQTHSAVRQNRGE